MDCRKIRERISDYRDGALPPAEGNAIDAHLRACRECAGFDRSLAEVREGLRRLPPLPAPPELATRVREAIAREEGRPVPGSPEATVPPRERTARSRLWLPIEAAAAVLLVASVLWYQRGDSPPPVPRLPASTGVPSQSKPHAPASTGQETRPARQAAEAPSGGVEAKPLPAAPPPAARKETASLPPGKSMPAPRPYSTADLPSAPAVRASSETARIVPVESAGPAGTGDPGAGGDATQGARRDAREAPAPMVLAAPSSRMSLPLPYGKEIVLEVEPEGRWSAGERIADSARRMGGAVVRIERDPSGGSPVAVSVLLPEAASISFLSELKRIGKVPPEEEAAAEVPAGPRPGTAAYTVRIRVP